MAQATAQQIDARWALFGMKSSRDSLPDGTGSFTTPLVWMFRATKAGALYAIIVFLIGFILGAISSSPIGLLSFRALGAPSGQAPESYRASAGGWHQGQSDCDGRWRCGRIQSCRSSGQVGL